LEIENSVNEKKSHGEVSGSEEQRDKEAEAQEGEVQAEEEAEEGEEEAQEVEVEEAQEEVEEEGEESKTLPSGEDNEEQDTTNKGKTEEEIQKEELTKEIFGDSDAEDDFNVPRPQQYADSEEDEDYEEQSSKKLRRLKKREREDEGSGEEGTRNDDEETEKGEKRKKKKNKKKKKEDKEPATKRRKKKELSDEEAAVEERDNEVEEERAHSDNNNDDGDEGPSRSRDRTSHKKELSDLPDFDQALERIKKRRPKKPKDDELEPIIEEFIAKMNQAAELDIQANQKKELGTHKIQLLTEVVRTLSRTFYFDKFLSGGGLSAIRRWLDRLPDGSIPNLNIREQLLSILQKLPLTTEQLQDSGVGKVVMGLWKLESETKANKKICSQLIEKWSRPIFKLSSRYEDLESFESDLPVRKISKRSEEEQSQFEVLARSTLRVTSSRIHAAIPEKVPMDFRKRPTASDLKVEMPNVRNPHVLAASADKLIKKKLGKGKVTFAGKVPRAERMSIEGRGVK